MSYVFLDLETTGLDADECHITEVGAIKTNEYGDILSQYHSMVRLPKDKEGNQLKVPEFIVGLTGITDELLAKEGRAIGDVMNGLHEFIGDSIVVAQYAPFDLSFIEKHFPVTHFFDTRTLAYALGHEKAGLKDLAATYHISLPEHHRSIGDARACKGIFFEMVESMAADGIHAGEFLNVVGTRPERMPKVYPKNTIAVVDYGEKKAGD